MLTGVAATTSPLLADVYELRTYTTNPDKLENLNARFRDHTVALFTKHGMESVGYWTPTAEPASANTLVYVLRHKSRDAAKASWKAFLGDPEWKKVAAESQRDGRILAKAPESVFMDLADYSPKAATKKTTDDGVYELRIYRCNPEKLAGLDARFRDHTLELFRRHGIQSVAYWHPTDAPAAKDTLIYLLKHDSPAAAKKSWDAFRADPEWTKVAEESQKDGKFLREAPEVTFLKATDYSALK
ncbi:NIPSNAP family protein [Lignipirellula cremea]|nr:NIPSNAP family protein [Lignipirellula cremea]